MVTLGEIAAKKFLPLQVFTRRLPINSLIIEVLWLYDPSIFDAGVAKAKLSFAKEIAGQDAVRLLPWPSSARRGWQRHFVEQEALASGEREGCDFEWSAGFGG